MDLTEAINQFRGPLVGLIASWGVPTADAAEMAQDSFADAYLSRETCRGDWTDPAVFGPWLRGFARNKYRNWRKSRSRRERRVRIVEPESLESTASNEPREDDERLTLLRSAIERLPARQREVIMMHYLEETSVRDVAMLLSVSPKAVEGRLYQARRKLKVMLEQPVQR